MAFLVYLMRSVDAAARHCCQALTRVAGFLFLSKRVIEETQGSGNQHELKSGSS